MGKFVDLTGQRFGKLAVLNRAENDKRNRATWYCKCECGKEKVMASQSLMRSRSCGCGRKGKAGHQKKDLAGRRFGRLIATQEVGRNARKNILWICQCDCGKKTTVASAFLIDGSTRSCGCLKREFHQERLTIHQGTKDLHSKGLTLNRAAQIAGCNKSTLQGVISGRSKTRKTFFSIKRVLGEENSNRTDRRKFPVYCLCCGAVFFKYRGEIERYPNHFLNREHYLAYIHGKRPESPSAGIMWDLPKPPKERRRNPETVAIEQIVKRE